MKVELKVPTEFQGTVTGDMNKWVFDRNFASTEMYGYTLLISFMWSVPFGFKLIFSCHSLERQSVIVPLAVMLACWA